jgi:hypothetical protein
MDAEKASSADERPSPAGVRLPTMRAGRIGASRRHAEVRI